MSRGYNAADELFEDVTVLGKPMLFTCSRIDRSTVPKGLFLYEVRHDDNGRGDPCQIAHWIMVNHWGTLITSERLPLKRYPGSDREFLDIDAEQDWNYEGGTCTLAEYMEKHPPQRTRIRER